MGSVYRICFVCLFVLNEPPELLATHPLPFWKEATFVPSVYENNLLGLQSCADKCGMATAGGSTYWTA